MIEQKDIREIDNLEEIDKVIRHVKQRRVEILNAQWEELYKSRCEKEEDFLSFSGFVKEIFFWSHNFGEESDFKDKCNALDKPYIAYILDIADSMGYTKFGDKVPKMICSVCACHGCPSLKEHLGYDCHECSRKMHYGGYEGYCDE